MTERASIHIKCTAEEKEKFLTLLYLIKAKEDKSLNNIDVINTSMENYNKILEERRNGRDNS